MKIRVNRISIHQSSKTISLCYFVLMVVYCLVFAGYIFLSGAEGGAATALVVLILPIFYLPIFYLINVILFWFYNQIAATFGGVEAEVDDHSIDNT